jgi:hypothetical protein
MSGINFSPSFGGIIGATEILQPLTDGSGGNVIIPILPAQATILPVFIPGGTRQAYIKWYLVIDSTAGNGGLQVAVNTSNIAIPPFICQYILLRDAPNVVSVDFIQPAGAFVVMIAGGGTSTMFLEINCSCEDVPAGGLTLSLQITEAIFDLNPGSFSKGSYSRLTILK